MPDERKKEYFTATLRFFKDLEGYGFLMSQEDDIFLHHSDQSQEILDILRIAQRDTHEFTYYIINNPYKPGTSKAVITQARELSSDEVKAVQEKQKYNANLDILKNFDSGSINNIGSKFKEVLEEIKAVSPAVSPSNLIETAAPLVEKLQAGIEHIKGFTDLIDMLPHAFNELQRALDQLAYFENDARHSKELLELTDEQLLAQAKEEQKAYRFRRDVKDLHITYQKLIELIQMRAIDKAKMAGFKAYLNANEEKLKERKYYMRTIEHTLVKESQDKP